MSKPNIIAIKSNVEFYLKFNNVVYIVEANSNLSDYYSPEEFSISVYVKDEAEYHNGIAFRETKYYEGYSYYGCGNGEYECTIPDDLKTEIYHVLEGMHFFNEGNEAFTIVDENDESNDPF